VRASLAALLVLALASSGCGYAIGNRLPAHIKTVAVPIFKNRTTEPRVEAVMTRAVVQAFSTNGQLQVVQPADADAILEGELIGYSVSGVAFNSRINVQQYRLIVTLSVKFQDVRRRTVLFQGVISEFADFAVQGTVDQTIALEKDTAVQTAAVIIGQSVVSRVVQRF
jgi:lipopolysaccharide assembly LptE-like protein